MLEDNSSLNIEELCRLCSFKEPKLQSIFDSIDCTTHGVSIIDKISLCLPVQIKKDDTLSTKICSRCLLKVEEFYEFWNNTAITQEVLENVASIYGSRIDEEAVTTQEVIDSDPEPDGCIKEESTVKEKYAEHTEKELSAIAGTKSVDIAIQTEPLIFIIKKNANLEDGFQIQPTLTLINKSGVTPINNLQLTSNNSLGLTPINKLQPIPNAAVIAKHHLQTASQASPGPTPISNLQTIPINIPVLTPISSPGIIPVNKGPTSLSNHLQNAPGNNQNLAQIQLPLVSVNIPALTPINNKINNSSNNALHLVPEPVKAVLIRPCAVTDATGKKESYVCKVCTRVCKNRSHFEVHLRRHSGVRPFKCSKLNCNKSFLTKDNLQSHTEQSHTDDSLPLNICFYCGKSFKTQSQLKIHTRIHVGLKTYQCKYCRFSTFEKTSLEAHTRRHTKNYLVVCKFCGKGFYRKYAYENHLVTHTGVFFCKDCGQTYSSISRLQYHRHKVHKLKEDPVICSHCHRTFATKASVKVHIEKLHLGVRYQCNNCGSKLSSKASLVIHLRQHTGEKPFQCHTCNKNFISKTVLKQHSVVHTKKKNYTCNICNRHFTRKSSLNIHIKRMHLKSIVDDASIFCEVKLEDTSETIVKEEIHSDEDKQHEKVDYSAENY